MGTYTKLCAPFYKPHRVVFPVLILLRGIMYFMTSCESFWMVMACDG